VVRGSWYGMKLKRTAGASRGFLAATRFLVLRCAVIKWAFIEVTIFISLFPGRRREYS